MMAFGAIKSVVLEVSKKKMADGVIALISRLVDCDSAKAVLVAIGATGPGVVVAATIFVGMELFKAKGERTKALDFKEHCDEVIRLLNRVDGDTEAVAEQLERLALHQDWVWARLSKVDRVTFAKEIVAEVQRKLTQLGASTDGLDKIVATYGDTILFTLEEQATSLRTIESTQAKLASKDDLAALEQRLLEKLRGEAPEPDDKNADRDLADAVSRLAREAAQGGATARRVLESDNPHDLSNYLSARRNKLEVGQALLNRRIDEEKVQLDREIAAVAFVGGRIDEAMAAIERILKLLPDDREALTRLAEIEALRGNFNDAILRYRRVLRLSAGDPLWEAVCHGNLSGVFMRQGELREAMRHVRRALSLATSAGSFKEIARSTSTLGLIYKARGELPVAEWIFTDALVMDRHRGSQRGIAANYGNLAVIADLLGNYPRAERLYLEALAAYERLGWQEFVAHTHANLGILHCARGKLDDAESALQKALEVFERLGHKEGLANCWGTMGSVMKSRGQLDLAEQMMLKALEMSTAIGLPSNLATQNANIGNLFAMRGDMNSAREWWARARDIYARIGNAASSKKMQIGIDDSLASSTLGA